MIVSDLEHLEFVTEIQLVGGAYSYTVVSLGSSAVDLLPTTTTSLLPLGISFSFEKSKGLVIYSTNKSVDTSGNFSSSISGVWTSDDKSSVTTFSSAIAVHSP